MKTIVLLSLLILAVSGVQAQNSTLENGHGVVSYYVNTNQTSWNSDGSVLANTVIHDGMTVETDADGGIDIVLGKVVKAAQPYDTTGQRVATQNVARLNTNTSVTINHTDTQATGIDEVATGDISLNSGHIQVSLNRRSNLSSFRINYQGGEIIATTAVFSLDSDGTLVVYSGSVSVVKDGKATEVKAQSGGVGEVHRLDIPSTYWQTSHMVKDATQIYVSPTQGSK